MLTALIAAARAAHAALKQERALARDIAELSRMDAAHLDDLGITRAQIPAYVRGRLPMAPERPHLRLVRGTGGARAAAPGPRTRQA